MKPYLYSPLAALLFLAPACSDDDDYTPAPPVDDDCMNVYFRSSNVAEYVFEPSDEMAITLTVSRQRTDNAASIPIVVNSKDEVFNIPSSVEFDEGEADAQITIDFPSIEVKKLCKFDISLPDEYIDPYTEVEGTGRFVASVSVDQWVPVDVENPFFYNSTATYFFFSDLEKLESLGRYRFTNFMGSGLSLAFTLDAGASTFHPVSNCYIYSDESQSGWYLYDDAADDYPVWNIEGYSSPVAELYFYETYGSTLYSSYSTSTANGRTTYTMTFSCSFTFEDDTYWQPYFYYSWTE